MPDILFEMDTSELANFLTGVQTNLQVATLILDGVLGECLEEVVDYAQAYAPVETGRLRDSIRVEPVEEMSYILIADPKNPRTGEGYAWYLEFGTSKMAEQAFLMPALETMWPKIIDRITGEMKDIFIIEEGGKPRDVWGRFTRVPEGYRATKGSLNIDMPGYGAGRE